MNGSRILQVQVENSEDYFQLIRESLILELKEAILPA